MEATEGRIALANKDDLIVVPCSLLKKNVQPFIKKLYDMVDDPTTNTVVSWGPMNNSFIVKDLEEFERDILPKCFKHNNFTSFARQLNSYGFKKPDPHWLEFTNECFVKSQKHLLSSIHRREFIRRRNQQPQHAHGKSSAAETCAEGGKCVLEENIESLKRDKNVLKQGIVELNKKLQTSNTQLDSIIQRLEGMEQRNQEMMTLLSKAMSPDSAPTTDSFSPGSDLIWGSSILKSMDPEDSTPAGTAVPMDI